MAASASTPADIANLALGRIGYRLRLGSLLDGSQAASAILNIYGQTRDVLLRDGEWQFCERIRNATLLKSAPEGGYFDTPWNATDFPPPPWRYTYQWPDACLKVRSLRPQPGFLVDMMPTANNYTVLNDLGYDPPRRVIAANIPEAILIFTGRVTDPSDWPVDFTEALASAIATRVEAVLAGDSNEKATLQRELMATTTAMAVQG